MLPKKDGFDVCRELRRAGVRTPIILLTARAQEAEKLLGFDHGADDYVTKPFSPRELRARIKAVLRRAEGTGGVSGDVYRFGDIEVDFERAELRRHGVAVDVTPLELKLLEAFIRRRGRVLSRDQLARRRLDDRRACHRSGRRRAHRQPSPKDRADAVRPEVPGQRAGTGLPVRRLRTHGILTHPLCAPRTTPPHSGSETP